MGAVDMFAVVTVMFSVDIEDDSVREDVLAVSAIGLVFSWDVDNVIGLVVAREDKDMRFVVVSSEKGASVVGKLVVAGSEKNQ